MSKSWAQDRTSRKDINVSGLQRGEILRYLSLNSKSLTQWKPELYPFGVKLLWVLVFLVPIPGEAQHPLSLLSSLTPTKDVGNLQGE